MHLLVCMQVRVYMCECVYMQYSEFVCIRRAGKFGEFGESSAVRQA